MPVKPELSVVVPVYGQFDIARACVSIQSILSQKGINYEVIVSEQGESPRFPQIPGVKHTFSYHKPRQDLSDFNPGNVRNNAIAIANGEFVYTNDADIIFLDPRYLSKVVQEIRTDQNKVFYRPFMRRLPINEFEEFKKLINEYGIETAISSLDLTQKYIATLNGKKREIRVFEKKSIYPKTFTAFEEDFKSYIADERNKEREPMFWNENRHCGGNLFRKSQFLSVGGYCEDFVNWGCEDSDLQWKFSERYDLLFFPANLEVMHLDHPKGYFSPEMWKRNEEISRERITAGLERTIEKDRRNKLWLRK
jgi:glycosyltransferase involved in cell wall biosynthesis